MKTIASTGRIFAAATLLVLTQAPCLAGGALFESPDGLKAVVLEPRGDEMSIACVLRDANGNDKPDRLALGVVTINDNYPTPYFMWSPDSRYLVERLTYRKGEVLKIYEFNGQSPPRKVDVSSIDGACPNLGERLIAAAARAGKSQADGRVDTYAYKAAWAAGGERLKVARSGIDDEGQSFQIELEFDPATGVASHCVVTIDGKADAMPESAKRGPAPSRTGGWFHRLFKKG